MTTYDHRFVRPAGGTGASAVRPVSWLGRKLGAASKAVQYGQMVSVLNRLPDKCLHQAGLRRSDIPNHAHRAIYGDG